MRDMTSRPSTWYEDKRSEILHTCEEKYDGNMVAFVIDLESQLAALKTERNHLYSDLKSIYDCDFCKYGNASDGMCDAADYNCSECLNASKCPCLNCTHLDSNWKWRGVPDQEGSDQA